MLKPEILKLSSYRFRVSYPGFEDQALELNFQPLVERALQVHRCERLVLKHWQARPRGERRFGVYEWFKGDGHYACHAHPVRSTGIHYDLQVAEGPIPSAALFYPEARLLDGVIWTALAARNTSLA